MQQFPSDDRGQAVPAVVLVLVVVVISLLIVGRVGGVVGERARARTAADAAALAGAAEGNDVARAIAEANGAELVAFIDGGRAVEVTVRVGRARATARAESVVAPEY